MGAGQHRIIAIDGPAASGKSSVAQQLAQRLGFVYVNSGAMYRAVTWHVIEREIDPADAPAIARLVEEARLECDLDANRECAMRIDGTDAAPHLRDPRVNRHVSAVSSVPRVRELLVAQMRAAVEAHDVVMEGRDIGSAVFPETPYKFYIDASPEIRFRRRAAQGQTDEIATRDKADSSRSASPLTTAPDAIVIDSSELSIAQVVDEIVRHLEEKGLARTVA